MAIALDLLLIVAFLLAIAAGWSNGAVREACSSAGLVAGVLGGLRFAPWALEQAPASMGKIPGADAVAFVAVFLGIFILALLVGSALAILVEGKKLSGPSRLLGLALGALRGLVLMLLLAGAVVMISPRGSTTLARSRVLPTLSSPMERALTLLPQTVRERFRLRWDAIPFSSARNPAPEAPRSSV